MAKVRESSATTPLTAGPGQVALTAGWRSLFEGAARHHFEFFVLPEYLPRQRWFGGKSRHLRSTRIVDWATLDGRNFAFALVEAQYERGAPEVYFLPLAIAFGKNADQVRETAPHAVLSAVITREGSGVLYDATFDDDSCAALLAFILDAREERFRRGFIRGLQGEALARLSAGMSGPLAVRRSSSEQSNSSIVYGERFILKIFRNFQAGPNPDCEIGQYLTEKARFGPAPQFAGSIEYHSKGAEPAALAMLQAFVPNDGDGWKWTLKECERYYENCATIPFPTDAARQLAWVQDQAGIYLGAAATLGRRTAELHRALACCPEDPAFSPEPVTARDLQTIRNEWREQALGVFDLLKNVISEVPKEVGESATLLLGRRLETLDRLQIPLEEAAYGFRTRIHGDYHLGQVLRVKSDFVIIDFEGEPARPIAERREKHSPLKDVAGMLRSFSYAALTTLTNYTALRQEEFARLAPWARLWERSVSAAFLSAYRETAGDAGFLPAQPASFGRLLAGYWLDKAIYELNYELNHRPTWVRIPLLGILSSPLYR